MNQTLARHGVALRRLFLVPQDDQTYGVSNSLFENIRKSHCKLKAMYGDDSDRWSFKFNEVARDRIDSVLKFGHVVALWVKNGAYVSISFDYDLKTGHVNQISFMGLSKIRGEELRRSMLSMVETADCDL